MWQFSHYLSISFITNAVQHHIRAISSNINFLPSVFLARHAPLPCDNVGLATVFYARFLEHREINDGLNMLFVTASILT
jgi:hypothetical protein